MDGRLLLRAQNPLTPEYMDPSKVIRILSERERLEMRLYANNINSHDHNGEMAIEPEVVLGTLAYIEALEGLLRAINEAPSEGECMRLIATIDSVLETQS